MSAGQMHPGMHPINDDLVRRLIAGRFPQWARLAVERFPSGGTVNAMYRLGEDMVMRPPLVRGGAGDVSMERTWLPGENPEVGALSEPALLAGDLTAFVAAMRPGAAH